MPYFLPQISSFQTLYANLSNNAFVSTTATTLLTKQITTNCYSLNISFTTCCSNSSTNTNLYFQITVDGTIYEQCATRFVSTIAPCAMHVVIDTLIPGTHTVAVQWYVSGGTGRISPSSSPTTEFATLVVSDFTND